MEKFPKPENWEKANEKKERKERETDGEFLNKIQEEERQAVGGVLLKFSEVPKSVRRGVMALAAVGMMFSAGEAVAGDAFGRNYEGWEKHFGYKQKNERSAADIQIERQKQIAFQEYQMEIVRINQQYENAMRQIRLRGDLPFSVRDDLVGKWDSWKSHASAKAAFDFRAKAWAAEEEARIRNRR